jgi:hypothetical protein
VTQAPLLAAGETSSGPPWLVITLAVIGLVAPVTVGLAPIVLERIRQRTTPAPKPDPDPPVRSTDLALEMVAEAVRDAWSQRDDADREAHRLRAENARLRAELATYRQERGRTR